jgi:hypothetical protein
MDKKKKFYFKEISTWSQTLNGSVYLKYKMQHVKCWLQFLWAEIKDPRNLIPTVILFLSNSLHKFVHPSTGQMWHIKEADPYFHQLSGWLVSNNPAGEEDRCAGPGLEWLHMVCGCRAKLDILPNSPKRRWRQIMVEKWTFNYLATALVDIPAVNMPIAHSLRIWDIRGIVLSYKTAHFREAFCP